MFSEETIASANTSSVSSILLSLDKISQTAFSSCKNSVLYQRGVVKIAVEKKGSSKEINAFVSINFGFGQAIEIYASIKGTERLSPFDRIVLDAVNTLYFEGHNEYITTSMVFHVMAGDKSKFIIC